jgi:hypothetical protein
MAYILDKLITMTPMRGGIEIYCEGDTDHHMTKEYVVLEVHAPNFDATPMNGSGETSDTKRPTLQLRVCPLCIHKFQMDVHGKLIALKA